MSQIVRNGIRGLWHLGFAASSVAVAAYAFAYLRYREFHPDDAMMFKFALSGLDVPAHFMGAGLALLLAPLQASGWIRRRAPRLHRIGGWLSAGAILIGGLGGLSLSTHAEGGWATGPAFALLALLWMGATANGIRYAIAGDIARHRRWMCRSLAMTFSAVTLRVILYSGMGLLHLPFLPVYVFAAWSCWTINLAVCEAWLRWPQWRARWRPGHAALSQALPSAQPR